MGKKELALFCLILESWALDLKHPSSFLVLHLFGSIFALYGSRCGKS